MRELKGEADKIMKFLEAQNIILNYSSLAKFRRI